MKSVTIILVAVSIAIAGFVIGFIELRNQALNMIHDSIEENKQRIAKLNEEAKTRCHDPEFYNDNFERCEYFGIKPQ